MGLLFGCLAFTDAATWALVALTIMELLLTAGLFYVGAKANKIDTLEARITAENEAKIQAQMANHTSGLKGSMDGLTRELKRIEDRMDRGDGSVVSLSENDRKTDVRIEKLISDMKEFMRTTFATRDDLKHHETSVDTKFSQLSKDMVEVGKVVAVMSSKMGLERR